MGSLLKFVKSSNKNKVIPNHVAFIMDGNGRWAGKKGLPRISGHQVGVDNIPRILTHLEKKGVKFVTLFAFSTENWNRPEGEVNGLIASFHGIILAAGRATMELGRSAFLPRAVGRVNATTQTPIVALVVNMLIGIAAILSGRTAEIITLAAFGAVSLYVISMVSLFGLRKNEPGLDRPFSALCYPIFPAQALAIAAVSFVAMACFNPDIGAIFVGILVLGSGYFLATRRGYNGSKTA